MLKPRLRTDRAVLKHRLRTDRPVLKPRLRTGGILGVELMFQIGEVARRLGVNSQTIYFYEREGLIPSPRRTEAGYRLFSEADVERLAFIIRVKSLGLTLEEIKEILELKNGRSLTCQVVYDRLNQKLIEIREKIQKLQALHDELLPLVKRCQARADSSRECVVLDEWKSDPP